jgi:uncharacterized protein
MNTDQNNLIQAMLDPDTYDHPVDHIELIQTHISWVFLTGSFAYKIKKPVNFGFLDFTQLDKRKYYCQQELKLNRRLAKDIYLDVIPILKNKHSFSLNGVGMVIEYAVKMKQFDQSCLLNKLIIENKITPDHIRKLTDKLAVFHKNISTADTKLCFGSISEVIKPVEHNFKILEQLLTKKKDIKKCTDIKSASYTLYNELTEKLVSRKAEGHIRECHGDLHLGNIALIKEEIVIFDGIEFNDQFRWIDTISEIAFLIMDLQDHNKIHFSMYLLNRYLEKTGDYSGLYVLKFYLLYRAMVRAKVTALRLEQLSPSSTDYKHDAIKLSSYLKLACSFINTRKTFIAITYGISGSGKSWLGSQLADQLGAIHIRSDIERKRLFGDDKKTIYADDTTIATYKHLQNLTKTILNADYPVIIDATFLDSTRRQSFKKLAEQQGTSYHIINCYTDKSTLEQRIKKRALDADNVSDADIQVMTNQLDNLKPLLEEELSFEIKVDTGKDIDFLKIKKVLE